MAVLVRVLSILGVFFASPFLPLLPVVEVCGVVCARMRFVCFLPARWYLFLLTLNPQPSRMSAAD